MEYDAQTLSLSAAIATIAGNMQMLLVRKLDPQKDDDSLDGNETNLWQARRWQDPS